MKSISNKTLKKFLLAAGSSFALSSAFATTIVGTTDIQIGGKVQSVNLGNRSVTVLTPQGGTESFRVGTNVQNLDKVRPGTNVVGTTQRVIRMTVLDASPSAVVPSPNGDQTVARVTAIDAQNSLIGLMDTQGAQLTIHTNSPRSVGDVVPGSRVLVDVVSGTDLNSAQAIR